MAPNIQRQINFDATSETAVTSINSSTSTTLVNSSEKPDGRPDRIFFSAYNKSFRFVWVKLQAASIDNLKQGIPLPPRSYWEMPVDNIYKGEISAISETGTPDIVTVEY